MRLNEFIVILVTIVKKVQSRSMKYEVRSMKCGMPQTRRQPISHLTLLRLIPQKSLNLQVSLPLMSKANSPSLLVPISVTTNQLVVLCARLFDSTCISCVVRVPYMPCILGELFDAAIAFSAFSANSVVQNFGCGQRPRRVD